jgi:predicted HTH transcriptional regulator
MKQYEDTVQRYEKIVEFAKRNGSITNAQIREIGGFKREQYHLNQLKRRGLLAHVGYNKWAPVFKRQKRSQKKPWCPGCGRMDMPKNWTDCDCLTS